MNQDPNQTIKITCALADAQFAICFLTADDTARLAIISACAHKTDQEETVSVVLTQPEVLRIANAVRMQGEGVATGLAQRLTQSLLPLLPEYPFLLEGFDAIQAQNVADFRTRANTGAAIIAKTIEAIERQQLAAAESLQ